MRNLTLVLTLLLSLPPAAHAARLRLDVTYTDGQIVSGPLTPDLTELPPSVHAVFLLNGRRGGTYGAGDLVRSSLVFGDAAWSAADMVEFSATLLPTDAGGLGVAALTYLYAAKDTPTSNGRIMINFPLTIQGTDIASGQAYQYRYDTSSQTVTLVPEPTSAALARLGILGMLAVALRHRSVRRPCLRLRHLAVWREHSARRFILSLGLTTQELDSHERKRFNVRFHRRSSLAA